MKELTIYFVFINVLTFLLYGIDKCKARRGKWRIPEETLIGLAIVGGSIGALLGMCHHRSAKLSILCHAYFDKTATAHGTRPSIILKDASV